MPEIPVIAVGLAPIIMRDVFRLEWQDDRSSASAGGSVRLLVEAERPAEHVGRGRRSDAASQGRSG